MFKDLSPKGIYYSFASLGALLMIVIGSFAIINGAMTKYVFKQGPQSQVEMAGIPPLPLNDTKAISDLTLREDLSKADKEAIEAWLKDYKNWQDTVKNQKMNVYDPLYSQLNFGFSMLIIGVPLFVFHIRHIIRDEKTADKKK